jgi:rhodanese-related sulfurtransferase
MVSSLLHLRSAARAGGYRDLPTSAAATHLHELRLIDVRESDEFVGPLGHLPRAELVPLATVLDAAADWDRAAPILLICRSGVRSVRAATALSTMGFSNLFNLEGGMMSWQSNGLPVVRSGTTEAEALAALAKLG